MRTRIQFFVVLLTFWANGALPVAAQRVVGEVQGSTSLVEGRTYMVAFPAIDRLPNSRPLSSGLELFISSRTSAVVHVSSPAADNDAPLFDRTVSIQPNETARISVPLAYMNLQSEIRRGYGLLVTSDEPISVSTFQPWINDGELARHLPVEGWGTEYRTLNFHQDHMMELLRDEVVYTGSQILIIANYDNTVVTYTPNFDTEGGTDAPSVSRGGSGTITLDRGQTFLIRAKLDPQRSLDDAVDLSGTLVRSTKPIGVISGHVKLGLVHMPLAMPMMPIYSGSNIRSNVHDAVLPIELAGSEFVTLPVRYGQSRVITNTMVDIAQNTPGDVVRFVGIEDNTVVESMRSNGSGFIRRFTLNRGESRYETSVEPAVLWRSSKPMIVGQYGKSSCSTIPRSIEREKGTEHAQDHPHLIMGLPFLQSIPAVERWVTYAAFHAPTGLDHFVGIVYRTSELARITIDGRSIPSILGGSSTAIPGTPFSYSIGSVSTGDHHIASLDPDVKWMAWSYGTLNVLEYGRAYGTFLGVDLRLACDDSVAVSETMECGSVRGKAAVISRTPDCGSLFSISTKNASNYRLVVDGAFTSGDREGSFQLVVVDPKKDARVTLVATSRSGRFIERTYEYRADSLQWTPTTIDFGTVVIGVPATKDLTITNKRSDQPLVIKRIYLRSASAVFTCSPSGPLTLGPRESRTVSITALVTNGLSVVDSIVCELECSTLPLTRVSVRSEEPTIYVTDRDFGVRPSTSAPIDGRVKIMNRSRVLLTVTGFDTQLLADVPSNHFFNARTLTGEPLISIFPLAVQPGSEYEFIVSYSPRSSIGVHTTSVPFYSNARTTDSIAVLRGESVSSSLSADIAPWTERVIDIVQTRQGISSYVNQATISNEGRDPVVFSAPRITGPDAASFSLVADGTSPVFPVSLFNSVDGQNKTRNVSVAFTPIEVANRVAERSYEAVLEFPTSDVSVPIVQVPLNGVAWQPQVKGADLDMNVAANGGRPFDQNGPLATGDIEVSNIHVRDLTYPGGGAEGTANVVISDAVFDKGAASPFVVINGPTAQRPWNLSPTDLPRALQIGFTPTSSGTYIDTIRIITTGGTASEAPYVPSYEVRAVVEGGSFEVTDALLESYVYRENETSFEITHSEPTTLRFLLSPFTGPDAGAFRVEQSVVDVPPGTDGARVRVLFTPDNVSKLSFGQSSLQDTPPNQTQEKARARGYGWRSTPFSASIVVTDARYPTRERTSRVVGHGLYIESTCFVREGYGVEPGQYVDVPVEIRPEPQAIDEVGITEMRVSLDYDPSLLQPRTTIADILQSGHQTEGWTVKSISIADGRVSGMKRVSLDLADERIEKSPIRSINTPLFAIRFDAYLSGGLNSDFVSPIEVHASWEELDRTGLGNDHVLFRDIPGSVQVQPSCGSMRRAVSFGKATYALEDIAPNPVTSFAAIRFSVGLDGPVTLTVVNSMGVAVYTTDVSNVAAGSYEYNVDTRNFSNGTYSYRLTSGPFVSTSKQFTIVR